MTREEAIKCLKTIQQRTPEWDYREDGLSYWDAIDMALSALRPVSREQVEKVWTGCPACKNGPPKLHIPAFRAMAICNQRMDHEAFDIELNGIFCLNCGRPLTPKAWEELKKRWEALNDAGNQ